MKKGDRVRAKETFTFRTVTPPEIVSKGELGTVLRDHDEKPATVHVQWDKGFAPGGVWLERLEQLGDESFHKVLHPGARKLQI